MHYSYHFAIEVASVQQCIKEHKRMCMEKNNITRREFLCKEIRSAAFYLIAERKETIYYSIVK